MPASIKLIVNAIKTIPISTAECERGFSKMKIMNIICSPLKSAVSVRYILHLMFISVVGPPVHLFKPLPFVKSWLKEGRRAATSQAFMERCPATVKQHDKMQLWNIMHA